MTFLIGAAASIADYNGIPNVSHIKDKLVEMTHLNESIYGTGIASSYQSHKMKSGVWQNDDMLAKRVQTQRYTLPLSNRQVCTGHCWWTDGYTTIGGRI